MQNKSAYIWGLIGKFAPQGLYLITTMILARFLSPDDFGEIGVLSIIFMVANVLLDSGLGGSLVKENQISKVDCSSIFVFNLFVSITIYLILFFSANLLENYFAIDALSGVIRTISLVFPLSALGIVPKALLNRELRFRESCYNAIVGVLVASICSIGSLVLHVGVYTLVIYQVVCVGITSLANYISSKYHISFVFSFASLRRLLPFGVTTTVITIIDTVYENIMTTMTGKFLNVQQAGYIYQAKRIEETLSTSLATTIGTVAFPVLTKLKSDKNKFVIEANSTFRIISSCSIPLLIEVAIFSNEIILVLFGRQWSDAGPYLKLLTFAGVFLIMETLFRNFIKALGEVKKLFYATLLKRVIGIAIIFISLVLSPPSLIYAYLFSTVIGYLINFYLYSRLIGREFISELIQGIKTLLPGMLLYLVSSFIFRYVEPILVKIAISIIFLMVLYFIILPLLGIHTISFIKSIICKHE